MGPEIQFHYDPFVASWDTVKERVNISISKSTGFRACRAGKYISKIMLLETIENFHAFPELVSDIISVIYDGRIGNITSYF